MNNPDERLLHGDITEIIIGAFFHVYNKLGHGFLEKVYENALAYELKKRGLQVEQQKSILVYYDGQKVGEFAADLVVANVVILELKAVEELHARHEAQLFNYLKATDVEVGLLLNFGPEASYRRKVFTNARKQLRHQR